MSLQRVLNKTEEVVADRLDNVRVRNGVKVFAKVRVADIIRVDKSTVDSLRGFALTSHFDFIVTDTNLMPLFAVEYDGPTHSDSSQVERDRKKDYLCSKANLPILHINSRYIYRSYRNQITLLDWICDVFFLTKGFEAAQLRGDIPLDEGFSAAFIIADSIDSISDVNKRLPYQISLNERLKLQVMMKKGLIRDSIISQSIGRDSAGNLRAIGAIRIDNSTCVGAKTAMRSQNFPVDFSELIDELLVLEVFKELDQALVDTSRQIQIDLMHEQFAEFHQQVKVFSSCSAGDFNRNPLIKYS